MKAATAKQIKDELIERSPRELIDLCLRLSRFKKENKELLTYLLFEASDEIYYIQSVEKHMKEQFEQINRQNYYYIKKGVRKILANVKKHIRYSLKKETEVALLISFCKELNRFQPSIKGSIVLQNMFNRQIELARKKAELLHEDLQHDYGVELDELMLAI